MKGIQIILLILLILFSLSCFGQSEKKEYSAIGQEILTKRSNFKKSYNNSDKVGKDSIIIEARNYLFKIIIDDIFTYWYGTRWDFNGYSRAPKQGVIACGYFVTNTLSDAGFNIPRVKWAQSASEVFIKKLANNNLKRFSNKSISEVESYLKQKGVGLYLVGLDCHVGFIVVKSDSIKFVHSNYYQPEIGVMSEDIDSTNPLNDSRYRIVGKLLSDEMIINWINNKAYK
jgi:hypothetical protein